MEEKWQDTNNVDRGHEKDFGGKRCKIGGGKNLDQK